MPKDLEKTGATCVNLITINSPIGEEASHYCAIYDGEPDMLTDDGRTLIPRDTDSVKKYSAEPCDYWLG